MEKINTKYLNLDKVFQIFRFNKKIDFNNLL